MIKLPFSLLQKIRTGQKITLDLEPVNNELEPVKEDVEILYGRTKPWPFATACRNFVHPCPSIKENTYIQQLLAFFLNLPFRED